MPEPPETLGQMTTPASVLERLELIRERYRVGLLDPPSFNEVLKLFQFRDAGGALWTPGAQSNNWYRWDGGQWTPGTPPDRLQLPELPLEIAPVPPQPGQEVGPPASSARDATCPKCGAVTTGKKFCTQCGAKLS